MLFGGKGGVGKTTCASATALHSALNYPKSSYLLVSTDPAHSLLDSIAGSSIPNNLEIEELDAQTCLTNFKTQHNEKLREIASRGTFLDDEDISRFLDLSLPGLDELMAFLEISRLVEKKSYDCIFVDTAPTGHTLRLLAMPELIRKWLGALDALLAKHRYMRRQFARSYSQDDLDEFLKELYASVNRMETLLRDPVSCCFIPVMLAEELSIRETLTFLGELKRLRIPVSNIVVNRLYADNMCPVCADGYSSQIRELKRHRAELREYYLLGVPFYMEEVRGLQSLKAFWEGVSAVNIHTAEEPPLLRSRGGQRGGQSFLVEEPADPSSLETTLLLFAGKGGVGKTTLACATAVRLARDLEGKEILLFSIDPAHSLSACLEVEIGSKPTRLAPGLTGMEIDAQSEFEALKSQYVEEVEGFIKVISPRLDPIFDREVMLRIMDLSPPGLDEVMALSQIMNLVAKDQYDIFILDSAPTGHLLRLLESPELIDRWLKTFFNLFIKYRQIFRLPKISQHLVRLSREIKRLQSLLRDPTRSALFAVTILTEMALSETIKLVTTCERMGIRVPMLFMNLATPPTGCAWCSAQRERELILKQRIRAVFPDSHHILIYRQGEPLGFQRLEAMGKVLYKSAYVDMELNVG